MRKMLVRNNTARLLILTSLFNELDETESELFYTHPEVDMMNELFSIKGFIDTPLAVAMAHTVACRIIDRGFGEAYHSFVHTHNEFIKDSVTYKYFDELFNLAFDGADSLMAHATLDKMLIGDIDVELLMLDKLDMFGELWECQVIYYKDLVDMANRAKSLLNL